MLSFDRPHDAVIGGLIDAGQPTASGIYLYLLKTGEFSLSRRMTLER